MPNNKVLKMSFDPNTIEHLGVRMYSTLPPVLAELIANSYDADATNVEIILKDTGSDKEIIVKDDGKGMSFNEINEQFLRIGRNRREGAESTTSKGRKVIGKKGLGKLSFFGIAHEVEISTSRKGIKTTFIMKWEDIKIPKNKEYQPDITDSSEISINEHGTTIILRKIQRRTAFNPKNIANSISRIFIVDGGFNITIKHNDNEPVKVSNQMRFSGLEKELEWKIPENYPYRGNYNNATNVIGKLIATEKPIPPNTNMRGITLFSRKKLVNLPEYFSDSTSSHFFSYLTGWLEVDFIDELDVDVIATNRQSLNWEYESSMQDLRKFLRELVNWLERDWRKQKKAKRSNKVIEDIHIGTWLSKVPDETKNIIEKIMENLNESELSIDKHDNTIKNIHTLVPEYPKYHWRHLDNEIRDASKEKYENKDYYGAFIEAIKRYTNAVRKLSCSTSQSDRVMMGEVFGADVSNKNTHKYTLNVAKGFKNKGYFTDKTLSSIEDGHKHLSIGVVAGCRNPLSHSEINDLRTSELFTESDCLDALSLLSHLFSRLDRAKQKGSLKTKTIVKNTSEESATSASNPASRTDK